MDPALRQLRSEGNPEDIIEAIIRLNDVSDSTPYLAKEVADFSDVRTVRLRRKDVYRVWSHRNVASLKAPRLMHYERPQPFFSDFGLYPTPNSHRYIPEKGKGVVMGVIDWGFDFAHEAFLDTSGRSRILALWDQQDRKKKGKQVSTEPQPYGYGRVFQTPEINRALATENPYQALQYHPGKRAHGTHVSDIAAGSARHNHLGGYAKKSDLVFVHMASSPLGGLADLGDSVRVLEAVDFILQVANGRPVCINMSIGRHGGAHTGLSLVERAIDNCVQRRKGVVVVHSAGNYGSSRSHAEGVLLPGGKRVLNWQISKIDTTKNELEIWYSERDEMIVELYPPRQTTPIITKLNQSRIIKSHDGKELGFIYHRANDPNTPDHHIDIIIKPSAPAGIWRVNLIGEKIADGRYSAWIERDSSGFKQSRFLPIDAEKSGTLGSIANTFHTITVGAADTSKHPAQIAKFASLGPTRDGRIKPDILAPGVGILAAYSPSKNALTKMSGASQASPAVAGIAACCLEASGGNISINDLKKVLVSSATVVMSKQNDNYIPPLVHSGRAIKISRSFRRQNQRG